MAKKTRNLPGQRLEMRQEMVPVLQTRQGMALEWLDAGSIRRYTADVCAGKLNELEKNEMFHVLNVLNDQLENRPHEKDKGHASFVLFGVTYELLGSLFGVKDVLASPYQKFLRIMHDKPYSLTTDKPFFFYRGNTDEITSVVGSHVDQLDEVHLDVSQPHVLVRGTIKQDLEGIMDGISMKVLKKNPLCEERDYWRAGVIMIGGESVLNLDLGKYDDDKSRYRETWRRLKEHFGLVGMEVPEYFFSDESS